MQKQNLSKAFEKLFILKLEKEYEKLWKERKMGRRWMYFSSLTEIMRDLSLY